MTVQPDRRWSDAPILDRNPVDPFLTASPWILVEGGLWRMWYVSATGWQLKHGRLMHKDHIRFAESGDGINWRRDGTVCIDFKCDEEFAISRPCVIKDLHGYKMWSASRGSSYRIGYAESGDGLRWRRLDDEAGIDVSPEGWDADMVEYPAIVDVGTRRFMLYNGNDSGRSGIGLAIMESTN